MLISTPSFNCYLRMKLGCEASMEESKMMKLGGGGGGGGSAVDNIDYERFSFSSSLDFFKYSSSSAVDGGPLLYSDDENDPHQNGYIEISLRPSRPPPPLPISICMPESGHPPTTVTMATCPGGSAEGCADVGAVCIWDDVTEASAAGSSSSSSEISSSCNIQSTSSDSSERVALPLIPAPDNILLSTSRDDNDRPPQSAINKFMIKFRSMLTASFAKSRPFQVTAPADHNSNIGNINDKRSSRRRGVFEVNLMDAIIEAFTRINVAGRQSKPTKSCPSYSTNSSPILHRRTKLVYSRDNSVQGAIAYCKTSFEQ